MQFHITLPQTALALFISALSAFTAPVMAQDNLTIQTASGPVIGSQKEGVDSWLGLPYAAPPVAELRWQPPRPAASWTTPRKANALANRCPQNADLGGFAEAGGSEDCLYLNVYRPAGESKTGKKLPVFVWIHGGALQVGQGGDYNPDRIVSQEKSLVVTLNYRLGVLGFLAHPALDSEGHKSGNYGLMDQQAALRWVKQNISVFGGDPDNVTIAGESSGGNSVMAHIVAPESAGLFRHVIAMSGAGVMTRYPAFGAPRPLKVARETGVAFAKALGCKDNDAVCLRAAPVKQILDIQPAYALNEFIIDGQVLPMHPGDAFQAGKINPVTLINGSPRRYR
ncbi:TPA: carboxylesterase/lipase family protein [Citrobacter freundii]